MSAIGVTCSSVFQRNAASLVVSYLVILPLALMGVAFWVYYADDGQLRLNLAITVLPGIAAAVSIALFYMTAARLLYPPDVGSEGKEVVGREPAARPDPWLSERRCG